MGAVTEPGLYPELTNEQYHGDPVEVGSLSVSGAKTILKAPAKFQYERQNPTHKDVFDFGSIAHAEVLEDSSVKTRIVEAENWTTKAAKEEKAEARLAGEVPLLRKEYEQIKAMVVQLRAHPLAVPLLTKPGRSEQSAFWQDDRTGVWRRARFDRLPDSDGGRLLVPDYKTAVSAEPDAFSRAAASFGYDMQDDWYTECALRLGLAADVSFLFVVQEKTAPYLVNVIELTTEFKEIGRRRNERALDLYKTCTETGEWPGYPVEVAHIAPPAYYANVNKETAA